MQTHKPLFRPEALRPRLAAFEPPPAAVTARAKLAQWSKLLASKQADGMKETELLPDFLRDVFGELLGYTGPAAGGDLYTLKREALVQVDGKYADAALGRFGAGTSAVMVAVEGKGPRDPLDRPFGGRKRSAVEQAMLYAVQLRIDWYLVTNLRETRLYHKGHDTSSYEAFDTGKLVSDDAEFRRFVAVLGAERVIGADGRNLLDDLLSESRKIGRELTADYYREYRQLREQTFRALVAHNPTRPPAALLAATQKILDRVLFVAFCEDRGLLPPEVIARAYTHADPFNPRPVWDNFKGLFRAVDKGNPALNVAAYNGGLFAPDPAVEELAVPDDVCGGFKRLADYEYGDRYDTDAKLIDVEILGHIFEQSISDLEELQQHAAAPAAAVVDEKVGPSKRKKEGAFYTPDFITRYIVRETVGPALRERFEAVRARQQGKAKGTAVRTLDDPERYDLDKINGPQREALVDFWDVWLGELQTVRVVDPSCGSGAFLIAAFDEFLAAYREAHARLAELQGGQPTYFDTDRIILTRNLHGMDLNGEAVEIARLSCWIKTAEKGKTLTALDGNIRQGNSVVGDGTRPPLDHWREAFPGPMQAGGFDAVIGNPPYVRQEWIKADKPFLQAHYRSYDGVADLYVYFYELGLNLLRPGGRLGYIVTNKWMKAGYGEALRKLYAEAAWLETVVDLGHNKQIFPDADVFPCILTARKPDAGPAPDAARVCVIPREQFRVDDLSRQIREEGLSVPRSRFGAEPWNLEPPGVADLMAKLKAAGVPLREFIGGVPFRGIMTGFNEAFLLDNPTKDALVAADPGSAPLFRPYLRGQDVDRWRAEWSRLWMVAMKSSGNHPWPWAAAADTTAAEAIFANTYPALHAHMTQYRAELEKRGDKGLFWWELRACAYWDRFDRPKVMYQEIQFHPSYTLDTDGRLANNKVFFLPTADLYLLGVLNSPLLWWHNWRYLPHMKDEALSPVGFRMEELPIPRPSDAQRAAVEAAVGRLVELARERQAGRAAVTDWLRAEFGVEKPSQKLQDAAGLDPDAFVAEVKKGRKKGLTVADVKRLKDEFAGSVRPLQSLARDAAALERQVSDTVNVAFGLTPAEVALVWQTAPPRMPISPGK